MGRMAFLTMFTFSTTTRCLLGRERTTWPSLPLSFPDRTRTVSPFLMFMLFIANNPLYSVSGAKDTIFMYFFSRSSRATGPKIRVPRGAPLASIRTAAFWSNLM